MTGAEHHNTFEKRHNFLQMSVWVYYNADKKFFQDFNYHVENIFNTGLEFFIPALIISFALTDLFL